MKEQLSVARFYDIFLSKIDCSDIHVLTDIGKGTESIRDLDIYNPRYRKLIEIERILDSIANQFSVELDKIVINEYSKQYYYLCVNGWAQIDVMPALTVRGMYVVSTYIDKFTTRHHKRYVRYRRLILKEKKSNYKSILFCRSVKEMGLLITLVNILKHYFLICHRIFNPPGKLVKFDEINLSKYLKLHNAPNVSRYKGIFSCLKALYRGDLVIKR